MDSETGEMSEEQLSDMLLTDPESGESIASNSLNQETGEVEVNPKQRKTKPFKIPENCIDSKTIKIRRTRCNPEQSTPKPSQRRQQYLTVLLCLILTVIFLIMGKTFGMLLCHFEIWLHRWCHYKNDQLNADAQSEFFYQSPMHVISSEFCGKCFKDRTKNNIKQLQNMRYFRHFGLESLRSIVT